MILPVAQSQTLALDGEFRGTKNPKISVIVISRKV